MLCIKNYDCKIPKLMRSPTTVFTKCLKIKLKVNMESQKTFLAVVWAEWELWRLMMLLHTEESLESPAHHVIPMHQADVAQNHNFPIKQPEQKDQRQACSECGAAGVESWLKHPSIHLVSSAPWCFRGRQQRWPFPVQSERNWIGLTLPEPALPLSHPPLGQRSQVLVCCSWSHPWNIQDSSTLFWATDQQQLNLLTTVSFHWSLVHESPSFSCWKSELSSLLSLFLLESSSIAAFQLCCGPIQKTETTEWEIQSCSAINEHNYSATLHCPSC